MVKLIPAKFVIYRTLAAMHTGVVQNKSIACQADKVLLD
jgi:hypothetical protein